MFPLVMPRALLTMLRRLLLRTEQPLSENGAKNAVMLLRALDTVNKTRC